MSEVMEAQKVKGIYDCQKCGTRKALYEGEEEVCQNCGSEMIEFDVKKVYGK